MGSKTFDEILKILLFDIKVYTQRAGYIPKILWSIIGFFFVCRKMTKCRSPPRSICF